MIFRDLPPQAIDPNGQLLLQSAVFAKALPNHDKPHASIEQYTIDTPAILETIPSRLRFKLLVVS